MLSKSKLNSIETLVPQAPNWHGNNPWRIWSDYEGEKKYEKMKDNLRNVSKKQENKTLNSVNSRT